MFEKTQNEVFGTLYSFLELKYNLNGLGQQIIKTAHFFLAKSCVR